MNALRSHLRLGGLCLVLGCLSGLFSTPALGAGGDPCQPELPAATRARLAGAAEDAALAPWQRDFMLHLAHRGETSAHDTEAAEPPPGRSEHASDDPDGSWADLVVNPRCYQSAVYDPVRNRMLVFAGFYNDGTEYSFNDVWALSLVGTPSWTSLKPTGTPPSPRYSHSAIYDPVRDRMVMFGGGRCPSPCYFNDVWALSLAGTPAWTQLTPTGTPPSARKYHSAIYDPVRDRMVVFGGFNGSTDFNDVWALSLAGTPAWTELTPSVTPLHGRSYHSAIYDSVRDRMVVFGGNYGSTYLNDVWTLSLAGTPAWYLWSPAGAPPSPRLGHSAIYDPVRDRMVVFGGLHYPSVFNDSWSLSLGGTPAWTQLTPTGAPPSPRYCHSAIYDPVGDRMIAFGGCGGYPDFYNDVSELSLGGSTAWAELIPSATPPSPRLSHSAVYDPVRDRMVVFGGYSSSYRSDVWALSLAGVPLWGALAPTGTPPSPRRYHSAIYDPVRDRMIVFGGYSGSTPYNDVWALSLAGTPAWTALTPTGTPPSPRYLQSAIYDPARDRMVMFGGADGSTFFNDVWALSLVGTPAWMALSPTDTPPGARSYHSAIYDKERDRMVVFGGVDWSNVLNDVWALSLADKPAWTPLAPTGTPPSPRDGHSAIYDPARDRMVVFGGYNRPNDTWALTLAGTPAWAELTPAETPPSARYGHTAIYDPIRDRMVVFGGYDASGCRNDVCALAWSSSAGVGDHGRQPFISRLCPPVPNPCRGTTTVSYTIAQAGRVRLGVYDVRGRLVCRLVDGESRAGAETVVWKGSSESGSRLAAGVYFIRLAGPGIRETRKVILLK